MNFTVSGWPSRDARTWVVVYSFGTDRHFACSLVTDVSHSTRQTYSERSASSQLSSILRQRRGSSKNGRPLILTSRIIRARDSSLPTPTQPPPFKYAAKASSSL